MVDRLVKLAAMFGSPNDGECLAAARALAVELQKRNTTLAGLVQAAEAHWQFEKTLQAANGLGRFSSDAARQERALRAALCRAEHACLAIPHLLDRLALDGKVDAAEVRRLTQ